MGYANPEQKITYSFGLIDFATTKAYTLKGPKGKTGRLREVAAAVETLFTAVTTAAFIKVGTVATPAAYSSQSMGVLAAGTNTEASQNSPNSIVAGISLPADTDFQVQFVAPTGGTPAGKAFPQVTIDWF